MFDENQSKFKLYTAIIAGVSLSLLATLLGYALSPQEMPFPTNPYLLLVPIISSGMSFGYWIGLILKDRESQKIAKVFFTSSFGSMTFLELIYLISKFQIIYIAIQIVSVVLILSLILSDVLESDRLAKIKKVIEIFSEDITYPILILYLINWYFGPFPDITLLELGAVAFGIFIVIKFAKNWVSDY